MLPPNPDSSDALTYSVVRIVVFVALVLAFFYFTENGQFLFSRPPFPADTSTVKQWTNSLGIFVAGAWLVAFVRSNSREYSEKRLVVLRVLGVVLALLGVVWRILLFPK